MCIRDRDKISCLPNYALPAVISPTAFTSMVPKSLYTAEEDMNEYEFKVVWALSELDNVKWWHRNISRLGFQINGPVHAYPDIIVMLHSGKVLTVSYTHLDVYKRQAHNRPLLLEHGQLVLSAQTMSLLLTPFRKKILGSVLYHRASLSCASGAAVV